MSSTATITERIGNYRWTICSLIFFATTINYLDRAVMSYVKPYLASSFGWNALEEVINYSNIEVAFKLAYAIGMLFAGRVIDKLGPELDMLYPPYCGAFQHTSWLCYRNLGFWHCTHFSWHYRSG
jgi:sugar phosphate permease